MKRLALLLVVVVVFLVLAGQALGARPELGPFTTTGYTTGYIFEPLPTGHIKFELTAEGGATGFFNGAFAFTEWGVIDPFTGSGVNGGLMTVSTTEGQSEFQFDGRMDASTVYGSFALLNANGAYESLKGQGTFLGNPGFFFDVAYEPCGKHTGTDCPAEPCLVRSGALRFTNNQVRWQLANYGDEPLTISSLTVVWPETNGELNEVRLGGRIYAGSLTPPSATLEAGWAGRPEDRQINPGQTKEITFRFAQAASTEPSEYTVWVSFAEGCAAAAVAFSNP